MQNQCIKFLYIFHKLAYQIKAKTIKLKDFVWHSLFVGETKTYNIFRFQHVTVCEVHKHLKQVSQKKATGVTTNSQATQKTLPMYL